MRIEVQQGGVWKSLDEPRDLGVVASRVELRSLRSPMSREPLGGGARSTGEQGGIPP